MKIETKFNYLDKFWAMHENKPQQFTAFSFNIRVTKGVPKIEYAIVDGGSFCFNDSDCYPTKEELLKSL